MSIKSLLQLILFLLIILIIGGVYFLYFYESPNASMNLNEINKKNTSIQDNLLNETLDRENLEDREITNSENIEPTVGNKNTKNIKNKDDKNLNNSSIEKSKLINKEKLENIKNLTKEIEYITSNKNGDIYKISAKYGKTNLNDSKVLDLEQVIGKITSPERSEILLTSDYAKYNYTNQNSKFFSNVEIKYDEKVIYCDNLELEMQKNIAIAYGNVLVKGKNSLMKAQTILMDIVTKDLSVNSTNNISVFTN